MARRPRKPPPPSMFGFLRRFCFGTRRRTEISCLVLLGVAVLAFLNPDRTKEALNAAGQLIVFAVVISIGIAMISHAWRGKW